MCYLWPADVAVVSGGHPGKVILVIDYVTLVYKLLTNSFLEIFRRCEKERDALPTHIIVLCMTINSTAIYIVLYIDTLYIIYIRYIIYIYHSAIIVVLSKMVEPT